MIHNDDNPTPLETRVVADARWIGQHGIGRVACELIGRLRLGVLEVAGRPTSPASALLLSRALARERPGLFYSPGFVPPWPPGPTPAVITVHDLIHLQPGPGSSVAVRAFYRRVVRPHVRRAPVTITVSEASRARLMAWAGVGPDRVRVVPNGVAECFCPGGARGDLPPGTVLSVISARPHKNLPRLLRAFALARRERDLTLALTMAAEGPLVSMLRSLGIESRTVLVGRPSDGELAALYRSAAAVIVPSLDEGFGLPALEAMASGTPVAASDIPALRKVVGGAGVLFDPTSVESMAAAILEITGGGAAREDRVAEGIAVASRYTWEAAAARLRGCLESVLAADTGGAGGTAYHEPSDPCDN